MLPLVLASVVVRWWSRELFLVVLLVEQPEAVLYQIALSALGQQIDMLLAGVATVESAFNELTFNLDTVATSSQVLQLLKRRRSLKKSSSTVQPHKLLS